MRLARAIAWMAVAVFLFPAAAFCLSPSQVFEKAAPCVVVIVVFDNKGQPVGQGSGVVIGDGEVVSNCHVTTGGEKYEVRRGKEQYPASLAYADTDRDLCQLNVPGLKGPSATKSSVGTLKVGSRLYAIGAPRGLELTLSEGIVSSLREIEDSRVIQTTAAISPGSSGGGLFDEQGSLVGITTFYLEGGQSLNFAVPVDWIADIPKRAATRKPSEVGASSLDWLRRAAVLEEKADWQALFQHCREWVRAHPGDAVAWFGLGMAYDRSGLPAKAIEAYREAIRIKPDYKEAWIMLWVVYAASGNRSEARKVYDQLKKLDPATAEKFFNEVILP